jgi:peroxiredoxin
MLSLSDLADQVVILAFYPADWSPVCGDQMTAVNPGADGILEALERMNGIKSDVQTESANYSG